MNITEQNCALWSKVDQKNEFKGGLKLKLLSTGEIWEALSMSWFLIWKDYVNFDNEDLDKTPDVNQEANIRSDPGYPGPIDNSLLVGFYEQEISDSLYEDKDFILVPKLVADKLFDFYGGYPRFPRHVINTGSVYKPELSIKIFPLRFEIHTSTRLLSEPTKSTNIPYQYIWNAPDTFSEISKHFEKIEEFKGNRLRIWARLVEINTDNDMKAKQRESNKYAISSYLKPLRCLNSREIGIVKGWKLISTNSNDCIRDFINVHKYVDLLIECLHADTQMQTQEVWPMNAEIDMWRFTLRRGDVVDACDKADTWYEAIVKEDMQHAKASISLHFRGWSSKFDEVIPNAQLTTRVQPAYTRTNNWRVNMDEISEVDVKVSAVGECNPAWIIGAVQYTDVDNDRVQVRFTKSSVASVGMHKQIKTILDEIEGTDEGLKGMSSKVSSGLQNVLNRAVDEDEEFTRWYDLQSDDICPLNTHTKRLAPTAASIQKSMYSQHFSKLNNNNNSNAYSNPNPNGKPSTAPASKTITGTTSAYDLDNHYSGTPIACGVVGIRNLGNTCYMNSILQCLTHTQPLADCMLSNRYKAQINTANPLGHKGELVKAYARLTRAIWSNAYNVMVPKYFKRVIGEFCKQFANYDQHDSHELMCTVLDGLHEDLNRIMSSKPLDAVRVVEEGNEEVLARESWRRYALRNDSELVDIFYGQTKSHVTCSKSTCLRESITFEPFNCLSLPIPVPVQDTTQTLMRTVLVMPLPLGSVPIKIDMEITLGMSVLEVKKAIVQRLISLTNGDDSDFLPVSKKACMEEEEECIHGRYFHLCLLYSSYTGRVQSTCISHEIFSKINRMNSLYLIELENYTHPKPSVNVNINANDMANQYSTSSSNNNGYSTHTMPALRTVTYVDIHLGADPVRSNSLNNFVTLFGLPSRITYDPTTLTNADIYSSVQAITLRYIPLTSTIPDLPYDVYTSNHLGMVKKTFLPNNLDLAAIKTHDTILVVWKPSARTSLVDFNAAASSDFKIFTQAKAKEDSDRYRPLTLYSCIEAFMKKEALPNSETLYCTGCKQHSAPLKKMDIWSAPDVLVIQLKRFQYMQATTAYSTRSHVQRDKISDFVDFPIEGLDLRESVKGPSTAVPPIYDLYAVSLHSGGLNGGHYSAICKHNETGKWFKFDDSTVTECTARDAVNACAYVLFYKRRSVK